MFSRGILTTDTSAQDRVISLGSGLPAIPERLLLAHARGEVLFICGAGVSRPAGLPDFRELVLEVYKALDYSVYGVLHKLPRGACNQWETNCLSLNDPQKAEVKRFIVGDYDVVLGMLERRLDDQTRGDSRVRSEVSRCLRAGAHKPAAIHHALMRLADRGGANTIVTTNFDLLLEAASKARGPSVQTYSLGSIPRPTRQREFAGVLHIHGALIQIRNGFPNLSFLIKTSGNFTCVAGSCRILSMTRPDFSTSCWLATARMTHQCDIC